MILRMLFIQLCIIFFYQCVFCQASSKNNDNEIIFRDDFENENNWVKSGCITEFSADQLHSGNYALKLIDQGDNSQVYYELETEAGKKYNVSCWAYREGANTGSWKGKIAVAEKGENVSSPDYLASSDFISLADTWVKLEFQFKAKGSIAFLLLLSQNATGDITYFDDLLVIRDTGKRAISEKKNYISTTNTIGYPHIPLNEDMNKDAFGGLDWRNNLRMSVIQTRDKKEIEDYIKKVKKIGINILLSSPGPDYLFADTVEEAREYNINAFTYSNKVEHNTQISSLCHKYGLKYILHNTSTMLTKSYMNKHPEFAAIDIRSGSRISGYGYQMACINNEDFLQEFFVRLDNELIKSGADGIMQDEIGIWWSYVNAGYMCNCEWCRKKICAELNINLPKTGEMESIHNFQKSQEFIKIIKWQSASIAKVNERIQKSIRKYLGSNAIRISYRCNPLLFNFAQVTGNLPSDMLKYYDSFGYEGHQIKYYNKNLYPHVLVELKYIDAYAEWTKKSAWALWYPQNKGQYVWCWMLAMSQGTRQWYTIHKEKHTEAWQPPIRWEELYQKILSGSRPHAEVGVMLSESTKEFNQKAKEYISRFTATCQALMDSNIPYRIIIADDLALNKTYNLKLIFSGGALNLNETEAAAIKNFVNNGGTFIGSGEFSLYDDIGQKRDDFLLSDLFGIASKKEVTNCVNNTFDFNYDFSSDSKVKQKIHSYTWKVADIQVKKGEILGRFRKTDGSEFPGLILNKLGKGKALFCTGYFEEGYFFFTPGVPVNIVTNSMWTDQRDERFKKFISDIVTAYSGNIMRVYNFPKGLLIEPRVQPFNDEKFLQLHVANLTGGVLKTGFITDNDINGIDYPPLATTKPDRTKPIEVSIREYLPTEKLIMVSPDFDGALDIPFRKQNSQLIFNLPEIYTYGLILLVNNNQFVSLNSMYNWEITTNLGDIRKPLVKIDDLAYMASLFGKNMKPALIFKDDFEMKKDIWIANNCKAELTAENSHSGNYSYKLTDGGGNSQIILKFVTEKGKIYRLSAWAYNSGSNKGKWKGKIAVSDISGTCPSDEYITSSDFIEESEIWTELECFFKAPGINTFIIMSTQNDTGDITYYDTVEIRASNKQ